ncbi:MAG: serine hydrolase domain-containing protein [Bacteroidia bacterium]
MTTFRKIFLGAFMALCLSVSLQAQSPQSHQSTTLEAAAPRSVGLSTTQLANIDALFEEYIDKGFIPGGVVMVGRKGKIAYYKSFGNSNIKKEIPYKKDDIFRIASMTKALTTTAVLKLYEQGKFLLDDPIATYIPAFANTEVMTSFDEKEGTYETEPLESPISIRHLLTHTSGIPYPFGDPAKTIYKQVDADKFGLSHKDASTEEMANKIAALPLMHQPGEKWTYGHSVDVLGYLVEVVSGQTLGEYLAEHVFQPLGMKDTYFYLPEDKQDRLIPVYGELDKVGLRKMPDMLYNYPTYGRDDYFAGGGGLSSTAMDYAIFCQMMLNMGEYNGKRILSRKTIELMTTDQLALMGIDTGGLFGGDGSSFCLGYALSTKSSLASVHGSEGAFSWGGIFNTKYWIDPQEEMFMVTMAQMLPFYHQEFWEKLNTIIYSSIDD